MHFLQWGEILYLAFVLVRVTASFDAIFNAIFNAEETSIERQLQLIDDIAISIEFQLVSNFLHIPEAEISSRISLALISMSGMINISIFLTIK